MRRKNYIYALWYYVDDRVLPSTRLDSVRVPLIIEDGSDHVVAVEIVMEVISVFLFSTTTISWMI
jgi:hypothetical protein